MPVNKKKGESKEEYIGRCIGIEISNGYEPSQAAAICYTKWENMDSENLKRINEIRSFKVYYGNTRTGNNPEGISSSNVWKYKYDDIKQELVIKFQEGSTYTYTGVDMTLFNDISSGYGTCITEGSNKWGSWYIGKFPSIGAAVYELLVLKNVPYSKGGQV